MNSGSLAYRAIGAFGLTLILTSCAPSLEVPSEIGNTAATPASTLSLPATAGRVLVALRPGSLPIGGLNGASETWFIAAGSTGGPYTFTSDDELPPGMSLDPDTGRLWGVPTVLGTWALTITATDTDTPTETGSLTVEYGVYAAEPADGDPSSP